VYLEFVLWFFRILIKKRCNKYESWLFSCNFTKGLITYIHKSLLWQRCMNIRSLCHTSTFVLRVTYRQKQLMYILDMRVGMIQGQKIMYVMRIILNNSLDEGMKLEWIKLFDVYLTNYLLGIWNGHNWQLYQQIRGKLSSKTANLLIIRKKLKIKHSLNWEYVYEVLLVLSLR